MRPVLPHERYRRRYLGRSRGRSSCNCHECQPPPSPFELGSWLDGSRASGPTKESVQDLINKKASPAQPSLGLTDQEAYGLAHEALENYQRTQVACLVPEKQGLYSRKELPRMVFGQLDEELFRSVLKGNVLLRKVPGRELPRGIHAMTTRADPQRNTRITITLSENLLTQGSRMDVLVTLVHQMIHAYYLQCCGYRNQDENASGHDLRHGVEFNALLSLISERCSLTAHRRSVQLWKLQSPGETRPWPYQRQAVLPSHGPEVSAGNSNCYRHCRSPTPIDEIDCKNWRNKALAVTRSLEESRRQKQVLERFEALSIRPSVLREASNADLYHFIDLQTSEYLPPLPRSQFHFPPEDYIELHFQSLAFPLFRSHIASHLPALTKSPCFTSNRIFTFPKTSCKNDLVTLFKFLHLDPSSSIVDGVPAPQQLPLIGPQDPSSHPVLKSHVGTYNLAQTLSFPPLAEHALSLLYKTPTTQEDSIAVLELIYHPPSPLPSTPNPKLRTWARSWLELDRRGFDHGWGDYAAGYLTNLNVLRSHPDWKEKYTRLREKGTVLITDLDTVEQTVGGLKTKLFGPAYDRLIPPVLTENHNPYPWPRSISGPRTPTPQENPYWWAYQQSVQEAEQA